MRVIYVTGSPGTGKSRVASKLAAQVGGKHVDLGKICLDMGFTTGYDDARGCAVVDTEKLRRFVRRMVLNTKENLVLEAHFIVKLPPKPAPSVFVLRCEPTELARRLKDKRFPEKKVLENVWAETLDFCLQEALSVYGTLRVHEIDVTKRSLNAVVTEIVEVVEGRRKPVNGICDWVSKLESRNELKKLLAGRL